MKLLREKFTNCLIKHVMGTTRQQVGPENSGTERTLLCLFPSHYQVFWNCMSIVDDLLGPIMVFKNRYRGVRAFYEHNCIT